MRTARSGLGEDMQQQQLFALVVECVVGSNEVLTNSHLYFYFLIGNFSFSCISKQNIVQQVGYHSTLKASLFYYLYE